MSIAAIIFDLLLNPLVPKETISKLKVQGYNYPEFPLNVKEQKYGRLGRGLVFDQEIADAKRDQATRAPLGSTKALAMASRKAEA